MFNKGAKYILLIFLLGFQNVYAQDDFRDLLERSDMVCVGEVWDTTSFKWSRFVKNASNFASDQELKRLSNPIIYKNRMLMIKDYESEMIENAIPINYKNEDTEGTFFLKYDANTELFNIIACNTEFNLEDLFYYLKDVLKAPEVFPVEEIFKIRDDISLNYYPSGFYGKYEHEHGYDFESNGEYAFIRYEDKTSKIFMQPGTPKKFNMISRSEYLLYFSHLFMYPDPHSFAETIIVYKTKENSLGQVFKSGFVDEKMIDLTDLDDDGFEEISFEVDLLNEHIFFPVIYKYDGETFVEASLSFPSFYYDLLEKEEKILKDYIANPDYRNLFLPGLTQFRIFKIKRMLNVDKKAGLEEAIAWLNTDHKKYLLDWETIAYLTLLEIDDPKTEFIYEILNDDYEDESLNRKKMLKKLPKNSTTEIFDTGIIKKTDRNSTENKNRN